MYTKPMIRIGMSLESSASVIGPSLSPFTPSAVPSATPSRITGNAQTTSMLREITESVTPPKKPDRIPSSTESRAVISAAEIPMISELRPP